MAYVMVGLRAAVGMVFLVAAVSKSGGRGSFERFRDGVAVLVPQVAPAATVVAVAVALVEWGVVVLLAVPGTVPAGFGLAGSALAVFVAVLVAAVRRGVGVPCRCFGSSARPVGVAGLWRNGLLWGAAVAGLVLQPFASAIPGGVGSVAFAAVAGALAGLVLVFLDEVVELFSGAGPAVTVRPGPRSR